MTRDEYRTVVSLISEKLGADPENQTLVGQLLGHLDSSEQETNNLKSDYEQKITTITSERDKFLGERDEARRAYRERFSSPIGSGNNPNENETNKKNEKEYRVLTIDEVLGYTD